MVWRLIKTRLRAGAGNFSGGKQAQPQAKVRRVRAIRLTSCREWGIVYPECALVHMVVCAAFSIAGSITSQHRIR